MTQTVMHIIEDFTATGRYPYALARLSCDHLHRVTLRETRGVCTTCGTTLSHQQGATFARCQCGAWSATHIDSPNAHVEADRLTKVNDVVECATCEQHAERLTWLRSLPPGAVHHARFDPRFSPGSYHLYGRDASSPTGVLLIGSVPATPMFDEALRASRISPLSPTER